eukprot:m51a1_g11007 hypothetical protein (163) ;mRNA; f:365862-366663
MSWRCAKCSKPVYHAERMTDNGLDFHSSCFQQYVKERKAAESASRNKEYNKQADVTPAYYRVSDPDSGAPSRMVTGPQDRQESLSAPGTNLVPSSVAAAEHTSAVSGSPAGAPCPACHAAVPATAKFCPECGAKNEAKPAACSKCGVPATGGKFCQECGTPL